MNEYIDRLKSAETLIDEIDDDIFSGAVEKIIVFDDTLEFKLKCHERSVVLNSLSDEGHYRGQS